MASQLNHITFILSPRYPSMSFIFSGVNNTRYRFRWVLAHTAKAGVRGDRDLESKSEWRGWGLS